MRKSASDCSIVGENKNKNQQVTPGHLLPQPITASVSLFVKCGSGSDLAGAGVGVGGKEPGRDLVRRPLLPQWGKQ